LEPRLLFSSFCLQESGRSDYNNTDVVFKKNYKLQMPEHRMSIIFKLSTPCILAVTRCFLQLNAHNILNKYIYHHLPPTCFGVCYRIFKETIAFLAQKLYALCNVVT
jgi:hypothetical protein